MYRFTVPKINILAAPGIVHIVIYILKKDINMSNNFRKSSKKSVQDGGGGGGGGGVGGGGGGKDFLWHI